MRTPFAILVLALTYFVSPHAHANEDFTYVTSNKGKTCYSRYGIPQLKSYCEGTADIPKVKGSGPFAGCVVESTMRLLEGKTNAIQFLADGTVQQNAGKPTVVATKDGDTQTYTITIVNKSVDKTQTVVKVVTNSSGKIVTASSSQYVRDPLTHKIGGEPDFKMVLNYGYVKDAEGKEKCEIDRMDVQEQYQPKIRIYSRWICNAVGDFLKQSHNLNDSDRDAHVLKMLSNYATNANAKDADAKFMYGLSPDTLPSDLGETSVPEMLSACKLSGATGGAAAASATNAAKKSSGSKATSSDD